MKIIGRDGPAYLLLASGEPPDPSARVRVLDPEQQILYPEMGLATVLASASWVEFPHDEELMNRLLAGARSFPGPPA